MPTENSRGRYLIAVPSEPINPVGLGVSDKASLLQAFPASPFGELGAEADKVITEVFLQRVLGEGGYQREFDSTLFTADEVGINYDNSPNFAEVSTANAGDPSSPYAPNITSPLAGVDPLTQDPAAGVAVMERLKETGIAGDGSPWQSPAGVNEPSVSARTISSQTLLNIVGKFGKSNPL